MLKKKRKSINPVLPSNMSDAISIFEEVGQINHRNNSLDLRVTSLETNLGDTIDVVNDIVDEVEGVQEDIEDLQDDIEELQTGKQNKLVAGQNIVIDQSTNTISATGGGGGGSTVTMEDLGVAQGIKFTVDGVSKTTARNSDLLLLMNQLNSVQNTVVQLDTDVAVLQVDKQDELTEGQYIDIDSENVISVTGLTPTSLVESEQYDDFVDLTVGSTTKTLPTYSKILDIDADMIDMEVRLENQLLTKQDVLTAGQNITINNNVISATGGGGSGEYITPTITQLHANITSLDITCYKVGDIAHIDGHITKASGTTIPISSTLFVCFFNTAQQTAQHYLLPKYLYGVGSTFIPTSHSNSSFITLKNADGVVFTNKALGSSDTDMYFQMTYIIKGEASVLSELSSEESEV